MAKRNWLALGTEEVASSSPGSIGYILLLLYYYISLYLHNVRCIRDYKNGRMSNTIYQNIRKQVNETIITLVHILIQHSGE